MKKIMATALAAAAVALALSGCGGSAKVGAVGAPRANRGPIVDKIIVDSKTEEDIALKDVAEGKSDIFWYEVNGSTFKGLADDMKGKLDAYTVPSTYWDLYFNPYPNAAPYVAKTSKGASFNPFAIREVRFAMNLLISRKQIIDEIAAGAGLPKFTPITLGQPNSGRYATIASKLGLTAEGDEQKALADIDAAMKAAADLPANKGKLVKSGQWWMFNGKPVSINFLIRVDDPNGRLKVGEYVSAEIEKAGIKVNRLEYDRTKCVNLAYNSDPANYDWNIYTEGWGGGQTYAFWDVPIAQMYASWQSYMPGGLKPEFWNYKDDQLDSMTQAAVNGRVKDADDYYQKCMTAAEMGLKDGIRVFLVDTTSFLVANKGRFNSRMVYGLGDGLDKYSAATADVKPEASGDFKGKKVLHITEFSARGGLFMNAWDPLGVDGFNDTYSVAVAKPCSDLEFEPNPLTGMYEPIGAGVKDFKTDYEFQGDKLVGKIKVPSDAVLWNAKTQKWDSSVAYVDVKGDGSAYDYVARTEKPEYATAVASATFSFKYGKWQDGRAVDQNDYRYAASAPWDWSVKKGDADKSYEESYASADNPNLVRYKGLVFNKDGSITAYGDVNFPMDKTYNASLLMPSLMVEPTNTGICTSWVILEAIRGVVADGKYVVNSNGDYTEIDLLAQNCVADIRAKLAEYVASKHVPAALAATLTPEEAVKDYQMAIAFIDAYKHAFISNGGFFIEKYDSTANSLVLSATTDPAYPFAKGEWAKHFQSNFARINAIKVGTFQKGADVDVTVGVANVTYPGNVAKAASGDKVKVTLVTDKENVYEAKSSKAGLYKATIPAKDLANLAAGNYTLIVQASIGDESGAVDTANLSVVF